MSLLGSTVKLAKPIYSTRDGRGIGGTQYAEKAHDGMRVAPFPEYQDATVVRNSIAFPIPSGAQGKVVKEEGQQINVAFEYKLNGNYYDAIITFSKDIFGHFCTKI